MAYPRIEEGCLGLTVTVGRRSGRRAYRDVFTACHGKTQAALVQVLDKCSVASFNSP